MLDLDMNKKLILLFFSLLPFTVLAQNFTGRVYDYDSRTPLGNVRVMNLTNKQSTTTKAGGQFEIPLKQGDVLEFSLRGYHNDTLLVTDLKPIAVLLPSNTTNLRQVNVQSARISPYLGLDSINAGITPHKKIEGDRVQNKRNNDRAGGLILNLGFDKMKAQREKEQTLTNNEGYENEIRLNFNEKTVGNLIPLKGQELKDFIGMYQPSVERVKSDAPFNYSLYIAQAYKAWQQLPPAQRKLPKFK
jgi:hypothetical protein